jgi:hypothetical protein
LLFGETAPSMGFENLWKPKRFVCLLRAGGAEITGPEEEAIGKNFTLLRNLEDVREGDLVACRFSYLPFANDLREEVARRGGRLLQTDNQYQAVSDIRKWYPLLSDLTPHTWFHLESVNEAGPFVVKGVTNSCKQQWSTHCFAKDRDDLTLVAERLNANALFANQPLVVRRFVPLRSFGIQKGGLPLGEEYRFFVAKDKIVAGGFYWSDQTESLAQAGFNVSPKQVPVDFLRRVTERLRGIHPFYALDVARTEKGEWIVIEIGDASMSGLAGSDPETIYARFRASLEV